MKYYFSFSINASAKKRWKVFKNSICFVLALSLIVGVVFGNKSLYGLFGSDNASSAEVEAATDRYINVTCTAMYGYAYEILGYVNNERRANGLNELKMDATLLEAAMQRAAESVVIGEAYSNAELSSSESLAHTRPNGEKCFTVSTKSYGENIAMGQKSPFLVMYGRSANIDPNNPDDMDHSSWMRSSGHRSNVLGGSKYPYQSIGIGVVYFNGTYQYYWSQEFGYGEAEVPAIRTDNVTRTFNVPVSNDIYSRLLENGAVSGSSVEKGSGSSGKSVSGKWHQSNGRWWYEYDGTYAKNCWLRSNKGWYAFDADGYMMTGWNNILGTYYYFHNDGLMAANEWVDGYWLDSSGAWTYPHTGSWHSDSWGWWYEDTSGWYACDEWVKINGYWYYFDGYGYMMTNTYVDGYWVGANGVCTF